MPIQTRLFVKTSLVYLLTTFVLGAVMAFARALGVPVAAVWSVVHAHLGFVGWLVNLVFGIAFWILPLDRQRFPATQGRYPAYAPLLCFALLNGGLLVRVIAEPWLTYGGGATAAALFAGSGLLQLGGAVVFARVAWQRVRAPARPAPGVR
ncbi:MAG: hypothetical protein ACREM2_02670 [Vulcanimicrobiaceae bacterium]